MADTSYTSTAVPWGPQATGLQDIYSKANAIYGNLTASPYDPYGATSKAAVAGTKAIASGDNPFLGTLTNTVNGITSGDIGIGTGGMFTGTFDNLQGPGSLSTGVYNDVANGALLNSNPYSDAVLNQQLDDISKRVKASASGFGSNFNTNNLVSGLGDVANQFNLSRYNTDMANMLNAAQGRSSENLARTNAALSAASGATGVESANISNRLAGANAIPAANDFRYADTDKLAQAGAAEDAMNAGFRAQPQEDLAWLQSVYGPLPATAGSSTSTQQQQSSGFNWLDALGLGVGALGAVGSFL